MSPARRHVSPITVIALGDRLTEGLAAVRLSLVQSEPLLHDFSHFMHVTDARELRVYSGSNGGGDSTKVSNGGGSNGNSFVPVGIPAVDGADQVQQDWWVDQFRKLELEDPPAGRADLAYFEQQTRIEPQRDLWLISTTFDALGLAVIPPAMSAYAFCQCMMLARPHVSCNLVLLTPDALKERDGRSAYQCTRRLFDQLPMCSHTVREISRSAGTEMGAGESELLVWLVSGRDDSNRIIDSPDTIFGALANLIQFCQARTAGAGGIDRSGDQARQMRYVKEGVDRSVNVFGVQRIFIPVREAVEAATDAASAGIIGADWLSAPPKAVDPRQVNLDVKQFLNDKPFLQLEAELMCDESAQPIRVPFSGPDVSDPVVSGAKQIERILEEFDKFEKEVRSRAEAKVLDARHRVTERCVNGILGRVGILFDQPEGGPQAAEAFLSCLTGRLRASIGTGSLDVPDDLLRVRDTARARAFEFFNLPNERTKLQELTRDLHELGELHEKEERTRDAPATLETSEAALWQEARERRLLDIAAEIQALEVQRRELFFVQEESEKRLDNPKWRREFLLTKRDQHRHECFEPKRAALNEIDDAQSTATREMAEATRQARWRRIRDFMILPSIAALLALVAAAAWGLSTLWAWGFGVVEFAIIGHAVYCEVTVTHRHLRSLRDRLFNCAARKRILLEEIVACLDRELSDSFEEHVINQTFGLSRDLLDEVERLFLRAGQLCDRLLQSVDDLRKSWPALLEGLHLSQGNLASPELLNGLYEQTAPVRAQLQYDVLRNKESDDFLRVSGAFLNQSTGALAAEKMVEHVRGRARRRFVPWLSIPLQRWLGDGDSPGESNEQTKRRWDYLLERGVPLLAQFQGNNRGAISRCSISFHDTRWPGLEEVKNRVFENQHADLEPLDDPHELLLFHRLGGLQVAETREYVTAQAFGKDA